ncbi:hypothetical protein F5148DRAFT_1151977 [Russula earlei]|uniref:Uncharacterized protein n=1 Tax=Russula earlei TaxID=71964 RepID=A0ACC0TY43_9AGAM|nr:hypothetical protein F5148DRAFT_1151977 [Russula earlei]
MPSKSPANRMNPTKSRRPRNALNNALHRQAQKMFQCRPTLESDIDPYPDDAVPIGLLAKLAISTSRDSTRCRHRSYVMPGPSMDLGLRKSLIDKTSPPVILVHRLVTPDDVEKSQITTPALTFPVSILIHCCFYAVPARRWEEDRSWLYTSLAIRSESTCSASEEADHIAAGAGDVELHPDMDNIDKSTATQFDKPSTLKEDFIVRKSLEWYKSSPNNHFDWAERFEQDSDHQCVAAVVSAISDSSDLALDLLTLQVPPANSASSFFHSDDEVFFTKSLESAKTIVTVFVDSLVPTGYICFAPDGYLVFAVFASAFMLKLLRPECSRFITPGLESEVYQVI